MFGRDLLILMKAKDHPSCICVVATLTERLFVWYSFGSVGMLKYDCFKIAEHVFAKSLAVATFVIADTPVRWTFLKQNCC